jgi:transcriptional regulator with XRE-family HTH domain
MRFSHDYGKAQCVILPIEYLPNMRQIARVIDSDTLLRKLLDAGITQAKIARVLRVDPSQISQLYKGKRQIKLDEAKKLVEEFDLDGADAAPPINEQTARLLILHMANRLGSPLLPTDDLVQELALDFQAFSKFARSHLPALSPEATTAFLAGISFDRQRPSKS